MLEAGAALSDALGRIRVILRYTHVEVSAMKKLRLGTGAITGGLLTAALTGLMYLAHKLVDLPYIPYEFFDWITRVLPGGLVTFGIDLMIDTMLMVNMSVADSAKTAEQIIANIQVVVMGAVAGAAYFAARSTWGFTGRGSGLVLGALAGLPMIAISVAIGQSPVSPVIAIAWLAVLYLAWGLSVGYGYDRLDHQEEPEPEPVPEDAEEYEALVEARNAAVERREVTRIHRRQFLVRLGAATATVTVVGAGVGQVLARSEERRLADEAAMTAAHQAEGSSRSPFPNADDPLMPAPGTRPEYTPVKDHYKVFIRVSPTVIDGTGYTLPVTGLVGNPLMLSLDEIRNRYEPQSHYVTLSCISGRLGTDLISTTYWTGVSMQKILEDANLDSNAKYLYITSGDGFYETVPLDEIAADERIMLAYDWDGHPIPVDHGFPLRIWRPDRYGMKQPKWITGMEITEEYRPGYWVERNWDERAEVRTVSVVDTVAVDAVYDNGGQKFVPVGGIAFAGAKQISKVEVRVDDGPWEEAQLRSPLSDTTWVIWRYDWPVESGHHVFRVRAYEGDGTLQIVEARENRPSGATGIHSLKTQL